MLVARRIAVAAAQPHVVGTASEPLIYGAAGACARCSHCSVGGRVGHVTPINRLCVTCQSCVQAVERCGGQQAEWRAVGADVKRC